MGHAKVLSDGTPVSSEREALCLFIFPEGPLTSLVEISYCHARAGSLAVFATGLAAMGLFGWRRKRRNAAAIVVADQIVRRIFELLPEVPSCAAPRRETIAGRIRAKALQPRPWSSEAQKTSPGAVNQCLQCKRK